MVGHLHMSILEHLIGGERQEEGEEEGMMVRTKWSVEPYLMWATVVDMWHDRNFLKMVNFHGFVWLLSSCRGRPRPASYHLLIQKLYNSFLQTSWSWRCSFKFPCLSIIVWGLVIDRGRISTCNYPHSNSVLHHLFHTHRLECLLHHKYQMPNYDHQWRGADKVGYQEDWFNVLYTYYNLHFLIIGVRIQVL